MVKNITEIATDTEYVKLLSLLKELKISAGILVRNYSRNNEKIYEEKRLQCLNHINNLQAKYDCIIHMSCVKLTSIDRYTVYYYNVDYVIVR